jgi:hypothetical protein
MIVSLAVLFAAFITLCGIAHGFSAVRYFAPTHNGLKVTQLIVMALCAVATVAAAVISSQLLPRIFNQLSKYELSTDGSIQHIEEYLVEVVELVKESVVVLAEDLKVIRCNEASKTLFEAPALVQERITDIIHEEDVSKFESAVQQALQLSSHAPVTVEYRVRAAAAFSAGGYDTPTTMAATASPSVKTSNRRLPSFQARKCSSGKVFISDESESSPVLNDPAWPSALAYFPSADPHHQAIRAEVAPSAPAPAAPVTAVVASPQYVWVESTMCKGLHFAGEDFEPDLRMVSRNIDGRKKETEVQYQKVLRASEEQARINAAKMRYISCIAHDLKTPLQSFCFSLDLLQHSLILVEQRELIEQAGVAVDLMKLTISQTMDINKALTGAKLVPRCTTVFLTSVIQRVKVIM